MSVMLEDRIVRPEFENSRLLIPGEKRIWTPKDWDGNVVVHAPLKPSIDALLLEAENFLRAKRGEKPLLGGAAAGAWTFPNAARTDLFNGHHDLDTNTHLTALFLSTSNIGSGSTTYAAATNEHANANGYTTGGISMGALTLSGTTTVTVDDPADMVWTASGGSIIARFAALYKSAGNILLYCLLDSTPADVTVTTGNTLTIALHASGIFTAS